MYTDLSTEIVDKSQDARHKKLLDFYKKKIKQAGALSISLLIHKLIHNVIHSKKYSKNPIDFSKSPAAPNLLYQETILLRAKGVLIQNDT